MNPNKKEIHDIKSWAAIRTTSLEIAEAIFEIADFNEAKAQAIWEEGDDAVLPLAFSKTDADSLYWGDEKVSRACK